MSQESRQEKGKQRGKKATVKTIPGCPHQRPQSQGLTRAVCLPSPRQPHLRRHLYRSRYQTGRAAICQGAAWAARTKTKNAPANFGGPCPCQSHRSQAARGNSRSSREHQPAQGPAVLSKFIFHYTWKCTLDTTQIYHQDTMTRHVPNTPAQHIYKYNSGVLNKTKWAENSFTITSMLQHDELNTFN